MFIYQFLQGFEEEGRQADWSESLRLVVVVLAWFWYVDNLYLPPDLRNVTIGNAGFEYPVQVRYEYFRTFL